MKKIKLLFLAVICSLATTTITSNVFAATYISYTFGYYSATIDLDDYTYLSAPYFSNTVNAVYSWNHCGLTSRSISPNTSSPNKIYQSSETANWAGLYEPITWDTSRAQTRQYITTKFKITLNTRILAEYNDTYKEGTACHELGHALGLNHNDDGADPKRTIMRSTINNTVNTPQLYDKNAVNYLWPNW